MRYFITGATGFVGKKLAEMLREAGHDVNALVRSPEKAGDLADLGVQLHPGDVTDKESMRAPMTGVDGVYHIAGWYKIGVKDESTAMRVNVGGTRNVLELMQELQIPKGVYTSTLTVNSCTDGNIVNEDYTFEGDHLSLYDRSKAEAHVVADEFIAAGVPLVIVMPGIVYGPGDNSAIRGVFTDYLQGKLPMMSSTFQATWGYVDDVAKGHILAMEKAAAGSTYIIAGPPHSWPEIFAEAEKITGKKQPNYAGSGVMSFLAGCAGLVEKIAPVPPAYSSESLGIQAGHTYLGTNQKAKNDLGYNPRSLAEGLAATLRHEMAELGMG